MNAANRHVSVNNVQPCLISLHSLSGRILILFLLNLRFCSILLIFIYTDLSSCCIGFWYVNSIGYLSVQPGCFQTEKVGDAVMHTLCLMFWVTVTGEELFQGLLLSATHQGVHTGIHALQGILRSLEGIVRSKLFPISLFIF